MFKSDRSVLNLFEKNYCCSIFILSSKSFIRYQFWLKLISEVFWFSVSLLFWNNITSCSWLLVLLLFWNNNASCFWSLILLLFWNNNVFCSWHAVFRRETTEHMSEIRLNVWLHFASFHIRLKLIITKYRVLLKCFVLIRCTILLCFLLTFLIFFFSWSDWKASLYFFTAFTILNDYQKTAIFLFLIHETVFFIKFFVNCKK